MATSARKKRNAIAQAEREERQRVELEVVRREKAEARAERQRQRTAQAEAAAAAETARLTAKSRRRAIRDSAIVISLITLIFVAGWAVDNATKPDASSSTEASSDVSASASSEQSEESAADVDSTRSRDTISYYVALQQLDEQLAMENEEDLVGLGDAVCDSLRNGNSQETVIEMLDVIGSPYEAMTNARIVAAADMYLC